LKNLLLQHLMLLLHLYGSLCHLRDKVALICLALLKHAKKLVSVGSMSLCCGSSLLQLLLLLQFQRKMIQL
jgi:hypothetical protein